MNLRTFLAASFLLSAFNSLAMTRYVDLNSLNPSPPYTNWSTAATVIQDAVDVASAGDLVLVTNGVYQEGGHVFYGVTNRVAVTAPVTVQSVNGPLVTAIRGFQVPTSVNGTNAIRCVYLTNSAALIGFTLTNGATRTGTIYFQFTFAIGGGVFGEGSSSIVSNCILIGNAAYLAGGGAYNATLNNCSLISNVVYSFNGGVGGGAESCVLNGCSVASNSAAGNGGGTSDGTLNNCHLIGNSARVSGGGAQGGTLNGCILSGNTANGGGGAYLSKLNNCILTRNTAVTSGGGAQYSTTLNNCIVYYNTAPVDSNWSAMIGGITLNYCCTTPLPSGPGNITNEPAFVDFLKGNLRLQSNSPCINAGFNAYTTNSTDLDENPRILGGTVDIGAYEFQTPASVISYAWLQQYDLPIDGSADHADSDSDGMDNWKEWICGTDPTNHFSVLRLLSPTVSPGSVVVSWQSVSQRHYSLQRATNLGTPSYFETLVTNFPGQTGTTTYIDATPIDARHFFYRVSVP